MQNLKTRFQSLNQVELKAIYGGEVKAIYYYDENGVLRVQYIKI